MYTGIIESSGGIRNVNKLENGCKIEIEVDDVALTPDDSVGISGVCLTVEEVGDDWFRAFLSEETVERTYLGTVEPKETVNIEYPLGATGRFDGHVVKGTVDTTIEIVEIEQLGG